MKTVRLAMIVIPMTTACLLFCLGVTGISYGQTASAPPALTVWTDKTDYAINETVKVSGYLDKSEMNLVHKLEIEISNPDGQWYGQDMIPVGQDGRFNYQFKIDGNATGGHYFVRVWSIDYPNVDIGTSFSVDSAISSSAADIQVKQGATTVSYSGDNMTEAIEYGITTQPNHAGQLYIDVFKNNHLLRTDTLETPYRTSFGKEGGQYYYYKLNVSGKKDQDTYTINFRYDGKSVERTVQLSGTDNGIVSNGTSSAYTPPSFAKMSVNFSPGKDLMVFTGIVYKAFSSIVVLTIHNPHNQLVLVAQEQPATDGTFSMSFMPRAPLWSAPGNYTLRLVSAGVNLTQNTFYFDGTSNTTNPMTPAHRGPPPLEQLRAGIKAQDITCNNGLQLVLKAEDHTPACVKPGTAQRLVDRGWGLQAFAKSGNTLSGNKSGLNQTSYNKLEIELSNQTYAAGYPVTASLRNVNQDYGCKIPSVSVTDESNQSLVFGPTPERDYGLSHCADPWAVTFYAGLEDNALVTKPTRFVITATLDNATYGKEFTAIPSNYSGTDITSSANQILPGFLTFPICLPPGPSIQTNNGTLVNYTGFSAYHRYLAESHSGGMEIDDYLLKPGSTGSFVMQVHQGWFRAGANLAGGLDFLSENLLNLGNDTVWKLNRPVASEGHPGLVVSYAPTVAHAGPQGYATITASISALPNATKGSYWVHLPPGLCGGHLAILTVGEKPLAQPPDYIGNDFDSNFVVDTAGNLEFELINPGIHTFENCSLDYVSNNGTTTVKTFGVIPPGMEFRHMWNTTSVQIGKRSLQCTTPPITKIYPNEGIDGLPW